MLHHVGDAAARAAIALLLDDERHADRFVVDEQAVFLLAVIAEPFAMIRQQHDRRPIVELVRFQVPHELADDFVRVGDLAVVGSVLGEAVGRRVRLVRLVQVQEEKRPRRTDRREPAFRDGFRRRAVALHLADSSCRARRRHLAVEEIEALRRCPVSFRSTNDDTMPPVV